MGYERSCLLCGANFTAVREHGKYCTQKCQYKSWTRNNKGKVNEYARKYRTSENGKKVLAEHYASQKFRDRITAYQSKDAYKEQKRRYVASEWGRLKARQYTRNRKARIRANGGEFSIDEFISIVKAVDYKCLCCNQEFGLTDFSVDHIVPLSKGGLNAIANIQPLCLPCNIKKGTKVIDYRKDIFIGGLNL